VKACRVAPRTDGRPGTMAYLATTMPSLVAIDTATGAAGPPLGVAIDRN